MKKLFYILSVLFISSNISNSQSLTPDPEFWMTDGPRDVSAIAVDEVIGGYTYIAGTFTYVGPRTGGGFKTTTTDPVIDFNFPLVNGVIFKTVSDGAGGFYIAGSFSKVGGFTRNNLARINSNGTVHDWNPSANNIVETIFFDGNAVYVGGQFTTINDTTRNRLAKLGKDNGAIDVLWNSYVDNVVYAIFVDNSDVYIGGSFIFAGSYTRPRIARLDKITGAVDEDWDPYSWNTVETISASLDNGNATDIYVGGNFINIGGEYRDKIAKLNNTDGLADPDWNPSANSTVQVIKVDENSVFAGGNFTNIGGQSRNYIAKLNTTDGAADPDFSTGADSFVEDIAVGTNYIYIAGYFKNVGAESRNHVAKLDKIYGNVNTWDPGAGHVAYSIALSDVNVYTGGQFITGGGAVRKGLARINSTTGELDMSWNPEPDTDDLYCLEVKGDYLYVGGVFNNISSVPVKNLAKLNKNTGVVESGWTPDPNNSVNEIIFPGDDIVVSGNFTNIDGVSINRLAKLNSDGDVYSGWNPNPNSDVNCIAYGDVDKDDEYEIYAGGVFTNIGGEPRNRIAKLNNTNGNADGWNPIANGSVNAIEVFSDEVYAAGDFTNIGDQSRNRIAKLNNTDGKADGWNPDANWTVHCLRIHGNKIYVGGFFSYVGGYQRYGLARLDISTGVPDTWYPGLNSTVTDIAFNKRGSVIIAGGFDRIGGVDLYEKSAVFRNSDFALRTKINIEALTKYSLITVEVRDGSSPYNIVATTTNIGGEGLEIPTYLPNLLDNTSYYIVKKHLNSIETWSNPVTFTDGVLEYDFTSASSQAYGNNMKLVNGKWSFFSGDTNQDGAIDVTDGGEIDNDIFNFVTGNVPTDINGDGIVELADAAFAENNAFNFVTVIRP